MDSITKHKGLLHGHAHRAQGKGRSATSSLASPRRNAPSYAPPPAQGGLRLSFAKTGDHVNIHRLLQTVFHGPSAAEFYAQLDEPGYDPSNRILVKDGNEIVAHLRLAGQTITLEGQRIPTARFMDLATAQEYRGRGLATALLTSGHRLAAERGALVGLVRTAVPRLFARQGWTLCGRHIFSAAAPRTILAELQSGRCSQADADTPVLAPTTPTRSAVVVRPMRRIDLPAIVRLYAENATGLSGCPYRSDEYWEWLLSRGACDQIYVATTDPETSDLATIANSIIGYAFVRQFRVVEMFAVPGREDIYRSLLARVCADASERDGWLVRCDLNPDHEIHGVLRQAGGEVTHCRELAGEVFMAKLLDPLAALRILAPVLYSRARRASEIQRPAELGIELLAGRPGGRAGMIDRYRLQLGVRAGRIESGGPSRHAISLSHADLAPLLLGDDGAGDFFAAGKLQASTRKARQIATAIFPLRSWWRSPLDDLTACPL